MCVICRDGKSWALDYNHYHFIKWYWLQLGNVWDTNKNVLQCLNLRQDKQDEYQTTRLLCEYTITVSPVESNLKCQTFSMLLYIYMALMACAPFSPECPQGGEKSRSTRRSELVGSHSGLKASCHRSVWEGATPSADGFFWNCFYGTAQESMLHLGFQEEILRLTSQGPWLNFSCSSVGCKRISPPLELHFLDSGIMMAMSFNHLSY